MINTNSYKLKIVGTGIVVAEVTVDAVSLDDAKEIAKTSVKPEDFEVIDVDIKDIE